MRFTFADRWYRKTRRSHGKNACLVYALLGSFYVKCVVIGVARLFEHVRWATLCRSVQRSLARPNWPLRSHWLAKFADCVATAHHCILIPPATSFMFICHPQPSVVSSCPYLRFPLSCNAHQLWRKDCCPLIASSRLCVRKYLALHCVRNVLHLNFMLIFSQHLLSGNKKNIEWCRKQWTEH